MYEPCLASLLIHADGPHKSSVLQPQLNTEEKMVSVPCFPMDRSRDRPGWTSYHSAGCQVRPPPQRAKRYSRKQGLGKGQDAAFHRVQQNVYDIRASEEFLQGRGELVEEGRPKYSSAEEEFGHLEEEWVDVEVDGGHDGVASKRKHDEHTIVVHSL